MISGVTKMRNTSTMNAFDHAPGRRASATPALPPSATAITVAPNAAMNELRIASPMPAKSKRLAYQLVSRPLTTSAKANALGTSHAVYAALPNAARRLSRRRTTSAIATNTAKRAAVAKKTTPSNSSPHHLVLTALEKIVNELPRLNECKNTNPTGIKRKISTSVVHTPSERCSTPSPSDHPRAGSTPLAAASAAARAALVARARRHC